MIINNINLKKFRKKYASSKEFIIKIRDKDKEINKNRECQDIIYYNGIKAFCVENKSCDAKHVKISIPENIYKLNRTNFTNLIRLSSNDIYEKINTFLDNICLIRESMKSYFKISLSEGKLKFGRSYFEDTYSAQGKKLSEYKKVRSFAWKRLELLEEQLNKLGTSINLEKIKAELNNLKPEGEIKFTLKNSDKLTNRKIVEVETLFILYLTFTKIDGKLKNDNRTGFKLPYMKIDISYHDIDVSKLNNFNSAVENAILAYEKNTKEELEKKYQHYFMLSKMLQNNGLPKCQAFEEEYYTFESDGEKNEGKDRGRIDCIFLEPKKSQSEIYLIELKVNEGVIGKVNDLEEHGINTHLYDIDKLLKNDDKLNLNDFLKNIVNRYNYRNKILGNFNRIHDSEKCNLHYWIICAINGKDFDEEQKHAKKVLNKIKKLEKDDVMNKLKVVNFLKENSNEYYLKTYDGKRCDIKLLFNVWESKGDMDKNKFLTIEEFREYYNI